MHLTCQCGPSPPVPTPVPLSLERTARLLKGLLPKNCSKEKLLLILLASVRLRTCGTLPHTAPKKTVTLTARKLRASGHWQPRMNRNVSLEIKNIATTHRVALTSENQNGVCDL